MSKQDQQGWKSMEFNMTTAPSVGRFSNDQQPTLYVKGSSTKFDDNDGRKTMAPYSNHGQLSHQVSQQSASDIVDLRTALGANSKPQLGYYLVPDGWGYPHKSIAIYETSEADSPEVIIQRHSQLIEEFVVNSCEALFVVQSRLSGETPVVS